MPRPPPTRDFQICSGWPRKRGLRARATAAVRARDCGSATAGCVQSITAVLLLEQRRPGGLRDRPAFPARCVPRRQAGQRLHQQVRAHHGEAPAELDGILLGRDFGFRFEQHVAGIEPGVDLHGGDAGARFAVDDRPLDGSGAAILRQQRGVHVDDAERREIDHGLRNDLAIAHHHHGVARRAPRRYSTASGRRTRSGW